MQNLDHIIEQAQKLGHKIEIGLNIKSGKEATVYRAKLDGHLVAAKIYKKPEERNFKNSGAYLLGKYYRRSSERRAVAKNNRFAKKLKHENWIRREFFMLQKLFDNGAKIPQPILQIEDAIFMELLGTENMVAPRLCDIELDKSEVEDAFNSIIKSMKTFWDFGIIHADLSEFNILWWKSKPYIIDFPQAVDKRTHSNPKEILSRDIANIGKYFSKYKDIDLEEIKSKFED